MLTLYIRTVIIYFALLFALRLMGKRQIGELRVSELIVTIILSEIAVQPITDRDKPLLYAIIPILVLLSVEVIVSFLILKSNLAKKLFYGSPTILIKRGKLMQEEMKRNRIEADELISELRQKGFGRLDEIYYAVLEENGKLSVFANENSSPVTLSSLVSAANGEEEAGIDHILVVDGTVIEERLCELGWDRRRLDSEIKRTGIPLGDIFILAASDNGKLTCIEKRRKK